MLADAWRDDPLAFLIGTAAAGAFFDTTYERQALVASAPDVGLARDRVADVVDIAAIDRIVTGTDLRTGDLLLADASVDGGIAESAYIDDQGYVDRGAVALRYQAGATLILNQAQRIVPALGRLCQGIEHVFSCHAQTNLYLTPAAAQGFPTHFDNHDVFVVQVAGEKLWRLYNVPQDIPYRGERFDRAVHPRGPLEREFTLQAGDVAYVPRGMMHDAETSGDAPSLHITVGLITRTWADLVLEAVAEVALRHEEFRRSLPPGYAREGFDRRTAKQALSRLGAILASDMRLDPAMDLLADTFVRTRAASNAGAIVDAGQPILTGDRFALNPLIAWRIAREGGAEGRTCLTVPGGDLWFTPHSDLALRRALSGDAFDLDDLGFEHAEALVHRLLGYGVIRRIA